MISAAMVLRKRPRPMFTIPLHRMRLPVPMVVAVQGSLCDLSSWCCTRSSCPLARIASPKVRTGAGSLAGVIAAVWGSGGSLFTLLDQRVAGPVDARSHAADCVAGAFRVVCVLVVSGALLPAWRARLAVTTAVAVHTSSESQNRLGAHP